MEQKVEGKLNKVTDEKNRVTANYNSLPEKNEQAKKKTNGNVTY